jgi:hypothetical protein
VLYWSTCFAKTLYFVGSFAVPVNFLTCFYCSKKPIHGQSGLLRKYNRTGEIVMDFLKLVAEVGFPIAAACGAGYFVFLTLKFILAGVTSSVNGMGGIIKGLDGRVDTMTNQLQRIDVKVSHALGLQPDYDRISRAEQTDQRKD